MIFCDLQEFRNIELAAKIAIKLSNYITNTVNIVLENTIDIQNWSRTTFNFRLI